MAKAAGTCSPLNNSLTAWFGTKSFKNAPCLSFPICNRGLRPASQRCGEARCWPAEHRKEPYEPHTPLQAEAWTGLFSKTVPSPASIVKSKSPSVGCSGKDWKVESAHCLSSVTVEMWVGYDFSQLRDFCIVVSLFCVLEKKKKNLFEIISTNMETDIWLCWSEILFVHNKNMMMPS